MLEVKQLKNMVWRRKDKDTSPRYTRLKDENELKKKVPKGYIPVVVGGAEAGEDEERFLVQLELLKEPRIAALLELADEMFGHQQGVLRIPCDAHTFRNTIDLISHGR